MDVSVIIVNYNTRKMLAECLDSLYKYTTGVQFEVIVVDNASVDGSKEYINDKFQQVMWIDSDINLGFGRANNFGAVRASGKYLFLLNSDTLLLNNAVKLFYDYAETHTCERIGVLGCWLLDRNLRSNTSFGRFPSPCNEFRYLIGRLFRCAKDYSNHPDEYNVDFVVGADMFVSRDIFLEFGGFDKNIFMYYEETDLQLRMAREGYLRRIIDGPCIMHFDGGSFGNLGLTFNRFIMSQHSYNYYICKHYSGIKFVLFYLSLCLIRVSVLFNRWSVRERVEAYKTVLLLKKD